MKKINLIVLILTIFVFSLFLIKNIVLAQWYSPVAPPSAGPGSNIVTNPLGEDLRLDGYNIYAGGESDRRINFDKGINLSTGALYIGNNQAIGFDNQMGMMKIPNDLNTEGYYIDDQQILDWNSVHNVISIPQSMYISDSASSEYEYLLNVNAKKDSTSGSLLKLQRDGIDKFIVTLDGNTYIGRDEANSDSLFEVGEQQEIVEMLDQSNWSIGYNTGGGASNTIWQSFTAGKSGQLTKFAITIKCYDEPNLEVMLKVYNGQGTSGSLLNEYGPFYPSGCGEWELFKEYFDLSSNSIFVEKDEIYTVSIQKTNNYNHGWNYKFTDNNTYEDGRASIGNNDDFFFSTYVSYLPPLFTVAADGQFVAISSDLYLPYSIYLEQDSSIFAGEEKFLQLGDPSNVILGINSGFNNTDSYNTFLGSSAGSASQGSHNLFVGSGAGYYNLGSYNTFVGPLAGADGTGDNNVFIGYAAGFNEDSSNKLYIGNTFESWDEPLIYGDFESSDLVINGSFQIQNTLSDDTQNMIYANAKENTTAGNLLKLQNNEQDKLVVDLDGNLLSQGDIKSNQYMVIKNNNSVPPSNDCNSITERGRLHYNYSNNKLYICDGSTGWRSVDTKAGAGGPPPMQH